MVERGARRLISSVAVSDDDAYPPVLSADLVGTYAASSGAGGGFVWDEVLEYRVWCHPEDGGDDYYYPFATAAEAIACSAQTDGAEEPLALILQREYIEEEEPGSYTHVVAERVTEWPLEFLRRPRRTPYTIPDFFAPDAPANRLAILRGQAPDPRRR